MWLGCGEPGAESEGCKGGWPSTRLSLVWALKQVRVSQSSEVQGAPGWEQECGYTDHAWHSELLMDASAPRLDTMMYGEPGDIWIFQVATLNRITNPEHVHSEAHAFTELCLLHKPVAFSIVLRR